MLESIEHVLREENATLRRENANLRNASDHAAQNAEVLTEQVNVLREALEFYADPLTYELRVYPGVPGDTATEFDPEPITADRGSRARAVLAQCQPESEVTP